MLDYHLSNWLNASLDSFCLYFFYATLVLSLCNPRRKEPSQTSDKIP